jgi:hypothetical protein
MGEAQDRHQPDRCQSRKDRCRTGRTPWQTEAPGGEQQRRQQGEAAEEDQPFAALVLPDQRDQCACGRRGQARPA